MKHTVPLFLLSSPDNMSREMNKASKRAKVLVAKGVPLLGFSRWGLFSHLLRLRHTDPMLFSKESLLFFNWKIKVSKMEKERKPLISFPRHLLERAEALPYGYGVVEWFSSTLRYEGSLHTLFGAWRDVVEKLEEVKNNTYLSKKGIKRDIVDTMASRRVASLLFYIEQFASTPSKLEEFVKEDTYRRNLLDLLSRESVREGSTLLSTYLSLVPHIASIFIGDLRWQRFSKLVDEVRKTGYSPFLVSPSGKTPHDLRVWMENMDRLPTILMSLPYEEGEPRKGIDAIIRSAFPLNEKFEMLNKLKEEVGGGEFGKTALSLLSRVELEKHGKDWRNLFSLIRESARKTLSILCSSPEELREPLKEALLSFFSTALNTYESIRWMELNMVLEKIPFDDPLALNYLTNLTAVIPYVSKDSIVKKASFSFFKDTGKVM